MIVERKDIDTGLQGSPTDSVSASSERASTGVTATGQEPPWSLTPACISSIGCHSLSITTLISVLPLAFAARVSLRQPP
jgi:hypothetical protein